MKFSEIDYKPYMLPNKFFILTITFSEQREYYERNVYNIVELLGDLGGVLEIMIGFVGIFVYPIAQFCFTLEAS